MNSRFAKFGVPSPDDWLPPMLCLTLIVLALCLAFLGDQWLGFTPSLDLRGASFSPLT